MYIDKEVLGKACLERNRTKYYDGSLELSSDEIFSDEIFSLYLQKEVAKKCGIKCEILNSKQSVFYVEKSLNRREISCPVCDTLYLNLTLLEENWDSLFRLQTCCPICESYLTVVSSIRSSKVTWESLSIRAFKSEAEYKWFIQSRKNKEIVRKKVEKDDKVNLIFE